MLAKLCLLWQDIKTRQWFHVANLIRDSNGKYHFSYEQNESDKGLQEAIKHGYHPHPTFPDLTKEYISDKLFSTFNRRIPSLRRKDYAASFEELGISNSSTDFEVLTITGGVLQSDSYEFVEPIILENENTYDLNFYLRGWRHYQFDSAAKIDSDDALTLQLDLDNRYDKNAVRVLKNEETIGYIPSFYSKFVRTILEENLPFDLKYRYHENAPSHYKVKLSLSGIASPTLVDQLKMSKMVTTDTQS